VEQEFGKDTTETQNQSWLSCLRFRGKRTDISGSTEVEQQLHNCSQETEELRSEILRLEERLSKLAKENHENYDYAVKFSDENDILIEDNTRLNAELAHQRQQFEVVLSEKAQLQQDIAKIKAEMERQSAMFSREIATMMEQNTLHVPKVSDATIRGDWATLEFAISQLVAQCLPESLAPAVATSLSQTSSFKNIPYAEFMLQNPILCHLWLQSWIWWMLWENIFQTKALFWGGTNGSRLSRDFECFHGTRKAVVG
jgi:hypothetical protein